MPPSDSGSKSVTLLLDELKDGSEIAATELWQRYFKRLVALAGHQLGRAPKRISDEEDIALNVFHSLFQGIEQGRFDQLDDRDDLWRLLVVMTKHKSMNQIRHQTAQKRGGRQVRGHTIFDVPGESNSAGFDNFFGDEPTPEFLVEIVEEQERLLDLLQDAGLREIAILRLEGYSVNETAEKIGISPRSVKRKLALIRQSWIVELQSSE